MADQVITKQELIDAQKDAQTLEDVVNGEPNKLVKTRLGREVWTLASVPQINTMTREEVTAAVAPKANDAEVYKKTETLTKEETNALVAPKANQADVDSAISGMNSTLNTSLANLSTDANKFYPTLAEANAAVASIAVNQPVTIGEVANGGLWYKATAGATSLTKSPYDSLTQAGNYADSNPIFKPVTLTGTEDFNTLPEGRYFIPNTAVATALDAQLPSGATSPKLGIIEKKYLNVSIVELEFTRYTQNPSAEYEVFRKTSNGGASSLVWLPWRKDPSRKEIDLALTLVGRYLTDGEDLNNLPDGRYFINPSNWATILNTPTSQMSDPDIGVIICHKSPTTVGGTAYQEIIRYTSNPANSEIEKFERTGNGGATISWLSWTKEVSRYEFDAFKTSMNEKPSANLFNNLDLNSSGAVIFQGTTAIEDGFSTLSMNGGASDTAVYYEQALDGKILKVGSNVVFKTEANCDKTGSAGCDIQMQFYNASGAVISSSAIARNTKVSQWEVIESTGLIPEGTVKIRFRLIRRVTLANTFAKFRKPRLNSDSWYSQFINPLSALSSAIKNIFYVSKTGNDTDNDGGLFSPFLTIQKAVNVIESGFGSGIVSILDAGEYRETVTASTRGDILIRSGRNIRASIFGSDKLVVTKTNGYSKVYQAPLIEKPTGMGGSRGKPMIAEWGTPSSLIEDDDRHFLHRGQIHRVPYTEMYEAASKSELDTIEGNGKWFWETGIIYFSATDGGDASTKRYEARVRPCLIQSGGSIRLERVDTYFSNAAGGSFNGVSTYRQDCRNFSSHSDGYSDKSNFTLSHRDTSLHNGNDGINGTVTSYDATASRDTTTAAIYFDPWSGLNGDDGISFHIRGDATIFGGLCEHNTKADVVHVTGASCSCHGTTTQGTLNGFYVATEALDGRKNTFMNLFNPVSRNNGYSYRAAENAVLVCVNPIAENPTIMGFMQTGAGALKIKGIALFKGDPSKIKSGNVFVESYQQVT